MGTAGILCGAGAPLQAARLPACPACGSAKARRDLLHAAVCLPCHLPKCGPCLLMGRPSQAIASEVAAAASEGVQIAIVVGGGK